MNQDFLDLLRAFAAHDVRFLIVGAYALAIHGRPRATGDLDVWIDATDDNAARVYAALRSFGAPLGDVSERDFARPGIVFQIGVVPGRIDILTQLSGLLFDEAWPTRLRGMRRAGTRTASTSSRWSSHVRHVTPWAGGRRPRWEGTSYLKIAPRSMTNPVKPGISTLVGASAAVVAW